MSYEDRKPYDLDDLMEILEEIRTEKTESLNYPSALLCLALEICHLRDRLGFLYDLVPTKYKKFNPHRDENPFFSVNGTIPDDPKDYEAAKVRMADLLRKINER